MMLGGRRSRRRQAAGYRGRDGGGQERKAGEADGEEREIQRGEID
jgi:hypothetical protein